MFASNKLLANDIEPKLELSRLHFFYNLVKVNKRLVPDILNNLTLPIIVQMNCHSQLTNPTKPLVKVINERHNVTVVDHLLFYQYTASRKI